MIYELCLAQMTSSFFGGTLYHYTLNIGLFILSMGLGSIAAEKVNEKNVAAFALKIEAALVLVALALPFYAVFAEKWLPHTIFYAVLWLTNIILGLLSGLELPLFNRLLKTQGVEEVLFVDYLGMFAGSMAFTFLLFPVLGVFSALWVAALLNLVALVSLVFLTGRTYGLYYSFSGVFFLVAVYFLFASGSLTTFLQLQYVN